MGKRVATIYVALWERARALARAEGVSLSALLSRALEAYLLGREAKPDPID